MKNVNKNSVFLVKMLNPENTVHMCEIPSHLWSSTAERVTDELKSEWFCYKFGRGAGVDTLDENLPAMKKGFPNSKRCD